MSEVKYEKMQIAEFTYVSQSVSYYATPELPLSDFNKRTRILIALAEFVKDAGIILTNNGTRKISLKWFHFLRLIKIIPLILEFVNTVKEIINDEKKKLTLELARTYHPKGTNGILYTGNELICYTIELPWKDNERSISCIPEGTYPLIKRWSERYGDHIHVIDVPNRDWILFHPANFAKTELRGCIAPVTTLDSPGVGGKSQLAMTKLRELVYSALDSDKEVELVVKKGS